MGMKMENLLSIRKKPTISIPVSLAIKCAPKASIDNVLYGPLSEELREWLVDGKTDIGFVSGHSGSGVSSLIKTLLEESNIDPYYINQSSKNFEELLEDSTLVSRSIRGRAIIIVVDGLDSTSGDKRVIGILLDHTKKSNKHKLVAIGHAEKKSTSNDFAKKWKHFSFPPPNQETIMQKLHNISGGRLSDAILAKIVHANPKGDIRSCINSIEMQLKGPPGGTAQYKDSFIDGIDGISYMFENGKVDFIEAVKVYEHEPSMIRHGVFENYLNFFSSISVVSKISDAISAGDALYGNEYGYYGEHTLGEYAFSAGGIKIAVKTRKCTIEKFGTLWSKSNNQRMNAKKLREVKGILPLPVEDLDIVRNILRDDFSGDVISEPYYLMLYRTGFRRYSHNKRLFKQIHR